MWVLLVVTSSQMMVGWSSSWISYRLQPFAVASGMKLYRIRVFTRCLIQINPADVPYSFRTVFKWFSWRYRVDARPIWYSFIPYSLKAELLTENLPTVSEKLPPTHVWQAAAYTTRQTCAWNRYALVNEKPLPHPEETWGIRFFKKNRKKLPHLLGIICLSNPPALMDINEENNTYRYHVQYSLPFSR